MVRTTPVAIPYQCKILCSFQPPVHAATDGAKRMKPDRRGSGNNSDVPQRTSQRAGVEPPAVRKIRNGGPSRNDSENRRVKSPPKAAEPSRTRHFALNSLSRDPSTPAAPPASAELAIKLSQEQVPRGKAAKLRQLSAFPLPRNPTPQSSWLKLVYRAACETCVRITCWLAST